MGTRLLGTYMGTHRGNARLCFESYELFAPLTCGPRPVCSATLPEIGAAVTVSVVVSHRGTITIKEWG